MALWAKCGPRARVLTPMVYKLRSKAESASLRSTANTDPPTESPPPQPRVKPGAAGNMWRVSNSPDSPAVNVLSEPDSWSPGHRRDTMRHHSRPPAPSVRLNDMFACIMGCPAPWEAAFQPDIPSAVTGVLICKQGTR